MDNTLIQVASKASLVRRTGQLCTGQHRQQQVLDQRRVNGGQQGLRRHQCFEFQPKAIGKFGGWINGHWR